MKPVLSPGARRGRTDFFRFVVAMLCFAVTAWAEFRFSGVVTAIAFPLTALLVTRRSAMLAYTALSAVYLGIEFLAEFEESPWWLLAFGASRTLLACGFAFRRSLVDLHGFAGRRLLSVDANVVDIALTWTTIALWIRVLFFENESGVEAVASALLLTTLSLQWFWTANRTPKLIPAMARTDAALALVSIAIALGLCELLARRVALPTPPKPIGMEFIAYPGARFYLKPDTVHEYNADTPQIRWETAISAEGFREDREYGTKNPKRYRVMTLGDSFTYGFGMRQDLTYPEALERNLTRQATTAAPEVINAGVTGYGPYQMGILLQDHFMSFEPDLIIVQLYTGNDLADELARTKEFFRAYAPANADSPSWPDIVRWQSEVSYPAYLVPVIRSSRVFDLLFARVDPLLQTALSPRYRRDYVGPVPNSLKRPHWAEQDLVEEYPALTQAWSRLEESLRDIATQCKRKRVPFLIVHIPDQGEIDPPNYVETRYGIPKIKDKSKYDFGKSTNRVTDMIERNHWAGITFLPIFRGEAGATDRPLYIHGDGHLSAYGHAVVALALTDRIVKDYLPIWQEHGDSENGNKGG